MRKPSFSPPVDGQHPVALQAAHRLGEVVVQAVDRVLLLGGHRAQHAVFLQHGPQPLADGSVIGEALGQNVAGALEGLLPGFHTLLRADIGGGQLQGALPQGAALGVLPRQEQLGQGLQPLFPGHPGAGAALGPVRPVEVLHLRQSGGALQGGGQLRGELALLLDGLPHLAPALLQAPQVGQTVRQLPDGLVVHGAVALLAVAGDEGHGVALV